MSNKKFDDNSNEDTFQNDEACECGCGTGSECGDDCSCAQDDTLDSEDIVIDHETDILKKRNDFLEQEIKNKEEELLRKAADLDNYRKRLIKESDDKIKYANQSVIESFLSVLDNIELTLTHAIDDSTLKAGLELTIKSFKDTLAKYGVTEIDSNVGTLFDPKFHDAMMMDNNPELENNVITLSVQHGYMLNDRVIRPAKVKVNKL